jgi:hypothetical protein
MKIETLLEAKAELAGLQNGIGDISRNGDLQSLTLLKG